MSSWLSEFSSPVDQMNVEGLQIQTPKETPLLNNVLPATGKGIMRGGVGVARAAQLAGSVTFLAQDYLWGEDSLDENSAYSKYMQATDPVLRNAEEAWTLDPEDDTGTIGQVGYGLGRIGIPLMLGGGNPTPLIASETTIGAQDALTHGATPAQAVGIGVTQGAVAGLGFKLPAVVGKNTVQRVASGVGINVGLGVGARGVQSGIAGDNKELAEVYDPFNPTYLATDAIMGGTFGAIAAVAARRRTAPVAEQDAITDTEIQQNTNSLADGDITSPNAANQHNRNIDSAQEALRTGQPVNVTRNVNSTPKPSLPGQASRIADAAQKAGIDPQTALVISHIETGGRFNPDAQNPTSSANGLYQVIDSTWKRLKGGDRADVNEQIRVGFAHIREVSTTLQKALKRAPAVHEEYMGHLLGPGGASKVLTADPNARLYDVVYAYTKAKTEAQRVKIAKAVVNNNGMNGLTVGQAIAKWKNKTEQVQAKIGNQPESTLARAADDTPESIAIRDDEPLLPDTVARVALDRIGTPSRDRFSEQEAIAIESLPILEQSIQSLVAQPSRADSHQGTVNTLHGSKVENLEFREDWSATANQADKSYFDNVFGDDVVYLGENGQNWSTRNKQEADAMRMPYYPHQYDVEAGFNNAFILTPESAYRLASIIPERGLSREGAGFSGKASGGDVVRSLKQAGYDGLIIRGFDDKNARAQGVLEAGTGLKGDIFQNQIVAFNPKTLKVNSAARSTGTPKQPDPTTSPRDDAQTRQQATEDAPAREIIDTAEAIPDLLIPTGQIDAEGKPIMVSAAQLAEQIRADRNVAEEQVKASEAAVACAIRNGV